MAHNGLEVEIKLAVADAVAGRALLRRAGFRVSKRKVFERNTVFDTSELALRRGRSLLRVREAGRLTTLTFKGPPAQSKHKSRQEIELTLSSAADFAAILERVGFAPVFRYEKYRTEFRAAGNGVATLDETPIGVYLELEGPPAWIDRTARRMGFAESAYVTASYARLYLDWCAGKGIEPGHMEFGRMARAH